MRQVGEKPPNLDKNKKKKTWSLGKITKEKISQLRKKQEKKTEKENEHQMLIRRDHIRFYIR